VDVKSSPDASPLSEQYETVAGLLSLDPPIDHR
jgi:hypothetical protein